MYRLILGCCAENVVVDMNRHTATIVDLFEDLTPLALPFAFPRLTVLWVLRRDQEDSDTPPSELSLELPGMQAQRFPAPIDFGGQLGSKCIMNFQGFVVTQPGTVRATLYIDGNEVGRTSFDIRPPTIGAPQIANLPQAVG